MSFDARMDSAPRRRLCQDPIRVIGVNKMPPEICEIVVERNEAPFVMAKWSRLYETVFASDDLV